MFRRVRAFRPSRFSLPLLTMTLLVSFLCLLCAGDFDAATASSLQGEMPQPSAAQEKADPAKTTSQKADLVVAQEDELAYVHAIQEDIRRRLGESMDNVELDLIMEGSDFSGTRPSAVRWDGDGSRLWFRWKRWDKEELSTFEYDPVSRDLRQLTDEEAERIPPQNAVWDRERNRALWTVRDSLVVYDSHAKTTKPLLARVNGARPTMFAPDGSVAVISYDRNLFAIPVVGSEQAPLLRQLTDIRDGQPPKEGPPNDHQRWLREQQLALFDVLQRAEEERLEQREESERGRAKPLYLAGWRAAGLRPDPTLTWVAVQQVKPASEAKTADVPNYVTASGFTEDLRTRTKVGDELSESRVGIIDIVSGAVAWADLGLEDRKVSISGGVWSPDGSRLLVHVRAQDNKDRWFAVLTPTVADADDSQKVNVDVSLVAHDHDEAWIGWSVASGYGWLPDSDGIYFISERGGTMHLYTVPVAGGEPVALTSGDFEVFNPRLTHDKSAFIFEASIPSPFEVQAYRLPIGGGAPEQLTSGLGRMDVTLSPDGAWIAGVGSKGNQPWELYLREADGAGTGLQVTESASPAFESYDWIDPEVVHFTAQDGTEVPARIYKPDSPHPQRPAVIFVHGAGYLHNVHHYWSSYSREYTFHHLLMERGYTVLDIDYRGSAGYGRDWRTAIYRYMGDKDLSDHVDGASYLVEEHGVDADRIGLYGGSYGGFITLMAMFTAPETFAAGASLRPVTDWAAYNHSYTSNILNAPVDDPESYTQSSPIYFAENLTGALLICHGLVDTNVHAQDTIRLAQRLIELRKENWEVALYPVENHGFRHASSWYDEYRRILGLFEQNLKD
jgi:dipeptidyl aminopeptidase/acylaminoacyl peptidase